MKAVLLDEIPTLVDLTECLQAISELITELIKKIIRETVDDYPYLEAFTDFVFKLLDFIKEYVRDYAEDLWERFKDFIGIPG